MRNRLLQKGANDDRLRVLHSFRWEQTVPYTARITSHDMQIFEILGSQFYHTMIVPPYVFGREHGAT